MIASMAELGAPTFMTRCGRGFELTDFDRWTANEPTGTEGPVTTASQAAAGKLEHSQRRAGDDRLNGGSGQVID